jgi:hypothetical protein
MCKSIILEGRNTKKHLPAAPASGKGDPEIQTCVFGPLSATWHGTGPTLLSSVHVTGPSPRQSAQDRHCLPTPCRHWKRNLPKHMKLECHVNTVGNRASLQQVEAPNPSSYSARRARPTASSRNREMPVDPFRSCSPAYLSAPHPAAGIGMPRPRLDLLD